MKNNKSEKTEAKVKRGTRIKSKARKKIEKGTILECTECGMVVVVDELCGCEEYHPVFCCGEEMVIK